MRRTIVYFSLPFLVLNLVAVNWAHAKPSRTPAKNINSTQSVWSCPMHPQVRQKGPGRCPICGMNLVQQKGAKKAEPEPEPEPEPSKSPSSSTLPLGHDRFTLALPQQQSIGVKTGVVTRRTLYKEIRAPGRVAFDPELYTAQNEYQEALAQLNRVRNSPLADVRHSATRMVESAQLRLKILGLSDIQIAAISQGKQASEAQLLLPQSGSGSWIYAEVFEMDLHSITPGLEVEISASSLSGPPLKGKVVSVDRILNSTTRTARVRIELPQAKTALRPETYVDTKILAPLGDRLAVPFDAIFDTGKESWVFLVESSDRFTPRLVHTQLHTGDWVVIESGLKEGDTIVTSANFLIDSESRLRGASLETPASP